jgi:hypothetical protein
VWHELAHSAWRHPGGDRRLGRSRCLRKQRRGRHEQWLDRGSARTTGGPTTSSSAGASKCGLGNGQKATGTPIKVGAIVTKQPGTDFTDVTNGGKAYFACVNANGGIGGRPIQYLVQTEQTDPAQVASLAHKLIESEKVVAMVGNISLIDCAVNHKYYEAQGFNVISGGIAAECYGTPNIAAVNMGARFSSDGAAQALVRKGAKKLVLVTGRPGLRSPRRPPRRSPRPQAHPAMTTRRRHVTDGQTGSRPPRRHRRPEITRL